ncbi:MAG: hypothetical protein JXA95_09640 [Spirochaetales bacterium]|nr:hypothetical protein [Spirochaetales bacterium]
MNLSKKILPILTGLLAAGIFYSCAGGPEATAVPGGSDVKVTEEKSAAEDKYEIQNIDVYKISREHYFLDDGSENGYKEYSYDEKGNRTGMINYRSSGEILFEEKYTLDSQGRTVKSELFDGDGRTSYTLYTYNGQGLLATEDYYNDQDVYLSGSRYTYDNGNRKVLWESFDDSRTLVLKSDYIYKGDDLIKVEFRTPMDKEDGSLDYSYEQGKMTKEVSINSLGKEERRTEYEYSDDAVAKEKLFQLGRLSRVNENEYDPAGNLIRVTSYNRSQKLLGHTEYEYIMFKEEKKVLIK